MAASATLNSAPEVIIGLVLGTIEEVAEEPHIDPDAKQEVAKTSHSCLGTCLYWPGLTGPGTAWPDDLDWETLTIYTEDDAYDVSEVHAIPGFLLHAGCLRYGR